MPPGLSENNPMRKELFVCFFGSVMTHSALAARWRGHSHQPSVPQRCSSSHSPSFDSAIGMGNLDSNPSESFSRCKSNSRDQQQHLEKSTYTQKMVEPVFALAGRQLTHHFVPFYPQQIKYFLISHSSHLYTSGITPELCCPKSDQCLGLGFRNWK